MKNPLYVPLPVLNLHELDQLSFLRLSTAPAVARIDHVAYWVMNVLAILLLVYEGVQVVWKLPGVSFIPAPLPFLIAAGLWTYGGLLALSLYKRYRLTRTVLVYYGSWSQAAVAAKALRDQNGGFTMSHPQHVDVKEQGVARPRASA